METNYDDLAHILIEIDRIPDDLYHYTKIEHVKDILQKSFVRLQFTNIEMLRLKADPSEGLILQPCIEEAIALAYNEGILDKRKRDYLKQEMQKIPGKWRLYEDTNDSPQYFSTESGRFIYVACFTRSADNERMFVEYAHKEGVAIHFDGIDLKEQLRLQLTYRGIKYHFLEVKYGNDIVPFLKNQILRCVKDCCEEDSFFKIGAMVLVNLFWIYEFAVKKEEYRWENEVRLFLDVPKDMPQEVKKPQYQIVDEGNYLKMDFKRHCCTDIAHSRNNRFDDGISKYLENNYYTLRR